MIPSRRVYWLLFLGTIAGLGVALVGSNIVNPQFLGFAILLTLVFDSAVLLLTILDAQWVKPRRINVSRSLLNRLSIGRRIRLS